MNVLPTVASRDWYLINSLCVDDIIVVVLLLWRELIVKDFYVLFDWFKFHSRKLKANISRGRKLLIKTNLFRLSVSGMMHSRIAFRGLTVRSAVDPTAMREPHWEVTGGLHVTANWVQHWEGDIKTLFLLFFTHNTHFTWYSDWESIKLFFFGFFFSQDEGAIGWSCRSTPQERRWRSQPPQSCRPAP